MNHPFNKASYFSWRISSSIKSQYTYPNDLRYEIEKNIGEYIPDVKHFRTEDRDYILKQIYDATKIFP